MTSSECRNVVASLKFFDSFLEFLTVMVLTFVLSQCSIVKFLFCLLYLRLIIVKG